MRSASPRSWPWLSLATLVLGAAFTVVPESLRILCEYDRRALADGEAWRLWTGHFVHFSARHAYVDLLTFAVLGMCVERRGGRRSLACLLVCAPPLLSLALYLTAPDLLVYRGASGLCAAFAAALGLALWKESSAMRAPLIALAGLFALKTLWEATGFAANASGLDGGIRVVWQAHVFGATFGIGAFAPWLRRIGRALLPAIRAA